jgi:hypothetical protein
MSRRKFWAVAFVAIALATVASIALLKWHGSPATPIWIEEREGDGAVLSLAAGRDLPA